MMQKGVDDVDMQSGAVAENRTDAGSIIGTLSSEIYRFCYMVGAFAIGIFLSTSSRITRTADAAWHGVCSGVRGFCRNIWRNIEFWFIDLKYRIRHALDELDQARKNLNSEVRKAGASGYLHLIALICRLIWRVFIRIFNYAAPIAAIIFLITTVNSYFSMEYALGVEYDGEHLGYIQDESVFEDAKLMVNERMVYAEENAVQPMNAVFKVVSVSKEKLMDADEMTDKMISLTATGIEEANGLYVDGEFIGAMADYDLLWDTLDQRLEAYREEYPDATVSFIKKVELKKGLYPTASLLTLEEINRKLDREEQAQVTYTVVKGDAPTLIAQKMGVAYSTLKMLNPDIEKTLLVGQEVLVSKSVPYMGVQVTRTEVYDVEIPYAVKQNLSDNYMTGYTKVTQKGVNGTKSVTAKVTYVDGIETARTVIDEVVIEEPIDQQVTVGGKQPLQHIDTSLGAAPGSFIWPVDGGYISCGYWGYYGHYAIDIAASTGTAVRAAAAGTVTKVAYQSNGYGRYVVINHGGSTTTLYGHNSVVYVSVGQYVQQGELIAGVGMTGNATGPHSHFEIRINGQYVNPAYYVGTYYNR